MANSVARNALWNLVSLGSGALVSVGIPPFLTRTLTPDAFGAWALVLQVAGYVNLLGFGMQTVVARHVAIAEMTGDRQLRDETVSTGFWILAGAAFAGMIALVVAVANMASLAPGWPEALRDQAAWAVLIVGASLAVSLPALSWSGQFVGVQRNDVPALAVASMRLLICATVIAAAYATRSLLWMAASFGLATLAGTLLQGLLWRRHTAKPTLAWTYVTQRAARALRDECLGLTVWSLAMLLISGLSLVLVARLDLPRLPYYAVAATLVLFMVGMVQALASATLPVAAQRVAAGDTDGLAVLLARSTRFCIVASLVMAAPLIAGGTALLGLWVGSQYAAQAAPLLAILTVGHCLRMAALPYVTVAVAAGLQSRMLVLPLLEGMLNLAASIALGLLFGASGVAMGTLAGALFGVVALFVQNPLRKSLGAHHVGAYLRSSTLPGLGLLVILAGCGAVMLSMYPGSSSLAVPALATLLVAAAGVSVGLNATDRRLMLEAWRSRRGLGRG